MKAETQLLNLLGGTNELINNRKDIWEKMHKDKDYEGINLRKAEYFNKINLEVILRKINKRIRKLLDKDHLIGHSYFMKVESIEDLINAFYKKIIPLLQEYFYGDFGKIGLVLGSGFVELDDNNEDVFPKFDHYESNRLEERNIFTIIDYRKCEADEKEDKFLKALEKLIG